MSPDLCMSAGMPPMLYRSVPRSKYIISPFTDTFGVRPNSVPQPTVQPALVLESLWEGHPTNVTVVGCELLLHPISARSCAIAAPPFTYVKSRSQYAYPTRAVAVDSQFMLISQL